MRQLSNYSSPSFDHLCSSVSFDVCIARLFMALSIASRSTGPAKKSSKYVPSFMPPAMAAAMAAVKDPKPQESVFALPEKSRGTTKKPRQIDLMLENLKRYPQVPRIAGHHPHFFISVHCLLPSGLRSRLYILKCCLTRSYDIGTRWAGGGVALRRGQQERAERIQTRREMGLEPEVEEYANADDNDPFTTNLCVSRKYLMRNGSGTVPSSIVSLVYQWCKAIALTVRGKKAIFSGNRGPN